MFDAVGVLGLLGPLAKGWREPKVIVVDPLSDIENEDEYQDAIKSGASFRWVSEGKVRARARGGWKPFFLRDSIGRPSLFTDRTRELLLMTKQD